MPFEPTLLASTLCISEKRIDSLTANLVALREAGFDAVDLALFEGWQNVDPSVLLVATPAAKENLAHSIRRGGVAVEAFNARPSVALDDEGEEERYGLEARALENFASQLDCKVVTLQPPRSAGSEEEDDQLLEATVKRANSLAEEIFTGEARLSFETHSGTILESPKRALAFAEALEGKASLTFDHSHFVSRGIPMKEVVPLLDRVGHIHLRQCAEGAVQAAFDPREPGPAGELISELARRSYSGLLSIEYFNDFDPELKSARRLKAFVEERMG